MREPAWTSIGLCPVILEQIFKGIDFERLKTYRLVCKEWNREICRSIPSTTKPNSNFPRFLDLLENGKRLELPTPFRNIHVSLFCSNHLNLTSNAKRLQTQIPITKLTLTDIQKDLETRKHAANVLQLCSSSLIFLETQYLDHESHCSEVKLQLPRLKRLELKNANDNLWRKTRVDRSKESEFFRAIISASPTLKELKMDCIASCSVLLETANLSAIEELDLSGSLKQSAEIWLALSTVRIYNLKKLALDLTGREAQHRAVISRFSETLERLTIGSSCLIVTLPFCPKLTHLELVRCSAEALNSSSSPALLSLTVGDFVATKGPFTAARKFDSFRLCDYYYESALSKLIQRFPDATSWAVPYTYLPEFIQAAVANKLKVEHLKVSVFFSDSRRRITKVQDAVAADKNTFSTLNLLPDLMELQLHNHSWMNETVNVDVRAIDFNAMPNLKKLCIIGAGLNGYLTLQEHLKGLESVVIVAGCSLLSSYKDMKTDVLKVLSELPKFRFVFETNK